MDNINFSLLLPTRARPKQLRRFLDSVYQCSLFPQEIEIILFLDEDDNSMFGFDYPNLKIKKLVQARNTMGFYNTSCLMISEGNIIIAVNDDIVIKTLAWDRKILNFHKNQSNPIYLAYPNDLHKKGKLPTFPILSKETCERLKSVFPIEYKGSFLDLHLFDIFMRLKKQGINRIFFLKNIIFEHLHFRNKKAKFDETYQQRRRFSDDCVFVSLSKFRQTEAYGLIRFCSFLNHYEQDYFFDVCKIHYQDDKEKFFSKIIFYFSFLIFDKNISFSWRIYLFYYFIARLLFSIFFDTKK